MNWIKQNWFKLGILLVVVCLTSFTIYYFNATLQRGNEIKAEISQNQKLEQEKQSNISEITSTSPQSIINTQNVAPKSKPSTQSNQTKETSPVKVPITNSAEQPPTPSVLSKVACEKLEKEKKTFDQNYSLVTSQSLSVSKSFLDMFSNAGDLSYGYQRVLSKKDTFISQLAQLNKAIDDLPTISFSDVSVLKIKFKDGANYQQQALDSLLLSFQYANAAIGVSNNGYLIEKSQAALAESRSKLQLSTSSFIDASSYYDKTITTAFSAKHDSLCQLP